MATLPEVAMGMRPTVTEVNVRDGSLGEIKLEVLMAHGTIRVLLTKVENAKRIGEALLAAKARLGRGSLPPCELYPCCAGHLLTGPAINRRSNLFSEAGL